MGKKCLLHRYRDDPSSEKAKRADLISDMRNYSPSRIDSSTLEGDLHQKQENEKYKGEDDTSADNISTEVTNMMNFSKAIILALTSSFVVLIFMLALVLYVSGSHTKSINAVVSPNVEG